jgi:hypothetical protein
MAHYFIDDQWNLIKGSAVGGSNIEARRKYQDQYFPGQGAKSPTVLQEQVSPKTPSSGSNQYRQFGFGVANRLTDIDSKGV